MMDKLHHSRFGTVWPLVASIAHHIPIVCAVVEGNSPGLVYVDDAAQPACALICTQVGFHFLAGRTDCAAFNESLAEVVLDQVPAQTGESEVILFGVTPGWYDAARALLESRGTVTVPRLVFRFHPERFAALGDWRPRVPQGLRMVDIDEPMALQMGLGQPFFASAAYFARIGLGVALLEGERVVSTCTSVFVGGGQAEIDIATDEAYRGRGLATLTAMAFVERALDRGLTPAWSCWPNRPASAHLAEKLGFERLPDEPCVYRGRV